MSEKRKCYLSFNLGVIKVSVLTDKHKQTGIYRFFRNESRPKLEGMVQKPTGKRDEEIELSGSYSIEWQQFDKSDRRFYVVEI